MAGIGLALGQFQCPPDCGYCCTHLKRDVPADEAAAAREFRDVLRSIGVYHCTDAVTTGLSLSNEEAARFAERGAKLHPRTWLLETRRRIAVVLDWHMPKEVCPFYADYKCTAYDARPLVCRAYPVMMIGGRSLKLAPECPKTPIPRGALRVEVKARNAIERAHAELDATAMRVLDAPDARFAKGLAPAEAKARLKRYRIATPEQLLASPQKQSASRSPR